MKKLLTVTLVLVFVLFILAACADSSGGTSSPQQNNADTPGTSQESAVQSASDQQSSGRNDHHESMEFTRGYWRDGIYTNAFANLTFRLPDGWEYASHEQLDGMTDMIQSSSPDQAPDSQMFFDMIAREAFATISIVIMFDPIHLDDARADYCAEKYIDGAMQAYQQRPDIAHISEKFEITFGGEQYYAFSVELDPDTTLTYFARRVGSYMLSISVLRLELYDVLSYFS